MDPSQQKKNCYFCSMCIPCFSLFFI